MPSNGARVEVESNRPGGEETGASMYGSDVCHKHDLRVDTGKWPHDVWQDHMGCRECARRVLSILLESPQWVMRRVERVRFCDDVSATRRVSMDFFLPSSAPRLTVSENEDVRLVPLTVMRRKTLVNFNIADVDGRALPLMSMRHTQALTEQMLLTLAEMTPEVNISSGISGLACAVAFGKQEELETAMRTAQEQQADQDLRRLMDDPVASRLIRRLADNFILLVAITEKGPSRRIVRFSYDEPLTLRYKAVRYDTKTRELTRAPARLRWGRFRESLSSLGLTPTVIRFPTPAAENSLSYHFEIEAPPGSVLTRASLVAARPGDGQSKEHVSWDHVAGGSPVVGLHAIEVENGSIAAAQVSLRADRRGWLTTNLLTTFIITALLWATAYHRINDAQITILASAMFAVAGAFVVFVVQPAEHQMVSRLLASVRHAVEIAILLLCGAGLFVTFGSPTSRRWLSLLAVACSLCTVLVLLAFLLASGRRRRKIYISPWEQGVDIEQTGRAVTASFNDLNQALERFGFLKPAIMVQTAEAEHFEKPWTAAVDDMLRERLAQATFLQRRNNRAEPQRAPTACRVPELDHGL
jgi:hypothetical protein